MSASQSKALFTEAMSMSSPYVETNRASDGDRRSRSVRFFFRPRLRFSVLTGSGISYLTDQPVREIIGLATDKPARPRSEARKAAEYSRLKKVNPQAATRIVTRSCHPARRRRIKSETSRNRILCRIELKRHQPRSQKSVENRRNNRKKYPDRIKRPLLYRLSYQPKDALQTGAFRAFKLRG